MVRIIGVKCSLKRPHVFGAKIQFKSLLVSPNSGRGLPVFSPTLPCTCLIRDGYPPRSLRTVRRAASLFRVQDEGHSTALRGKPDQCVGKFSFVQLVGPPRFPSAALMPPAFSDRGWVCAIEGQRNPPAMPTGLCLPGFTGVGAVPRMARPSGSEAGQRRRVSLLAGSWETVPDSGACYTLSHRSGLENSWYASGKSGRPRVDSSISSGHRSFVSQAAMPSHLGRLQTVAAKMPLRHNRAPRLDVMFQWVIHPPSMR